MAMAMTRVQASWPKSRGIARVEMIIIVLIVGMLLALILPALQASRERARLAQCAGNLRQLAEAAQAYASLHNSLPAGSYNTASHPHDFGVFTRLLPGLGQTPLYNAINHSLAHVEPANLTVGSFSLGVLYCPSDPEAARPALLHYSGNPNSPLVIPPGRWHQRFCSYAGSAGTWDLDINPFAANYPERKASMNGVIFGMSAVAPADITDGAGHTFLLGERAHGILGVSTIASRLNTWTGTALAEYHFWQSGETVDTLLETWAPPDQYKIGVGVPKNENLPYLAANASSFHGPGGANFAFCDGSVRFIKDTIESWPLNRANIPAPIFYDDRAGTWSLRPGMKMGLYQALSTRDGDEVIPSFPP